MQVVLYHANCNDGLFAAHVVWSKAPSKTLCIPITYSKFDKQTTEEFIEDTILGGASFASASRFSGLTDVTHKDYKAKVESMCVYLVDIIVTPLKLKALSEVFGKVVVYDHHKTNIDLYKSMFGDMDGFIETEQEVYLKPYENTEVWFSKEVSGALYTHRKLNGTQRWAYHLELVSDYDTWTKKISTSDAYAAGIRGISPSSMLGLNKIINEGTEQVIAIGEFFTKDREVRSHSAIKRAVPITVNHDGKSYKVAMICGELSLSSLIGNLAVTEYGYDIGIIYTVIPNDEVACSIRSDKPLDSSFLSLSFGGGGHAQASGFSFSYDDLISVLKTKVLSV